MAGAFSKLFSFLRSPAAGKAGSKIPSLGQVEGAGKALREPAEPPPITPQEQRLRNYEAWVERRKLAEQEAERRQRELNERDPVWRFVHLGETKSWPSSTNVDSAWYAIKEYSLFVKFKDGSTYRYENVSPAEAESLARSTSAGTWVWQSLRIVGTGGKGARKEYQLVSSGSRGRAWEQTPDTAREHAEKVAAASGAKSVYEKLGKFSLKKPITNKRQPRK